ncbi:MAG: ABC transporter permease subunit [Sporolactobacillus sp.]
MALENKYSLFFPQLIRHELKSGYWRRKKSRNKTWRRINFIFYLALALLVTTYFGLKVHLELKYVWNVCWGIPWIAFGISIGNIKIESSEGTIGWWLALPYSRIALISSKFWAMILRSLKIMCLIFLAIIAFAAYAVLISKGLTWNDFQNFLAHGLEPILLSLLALPFMVSAGTLAGVIRLTRWRQAMSMFWVIWGLSWGLGSSTGIYSIIRYASELIIIGCFLLASLAISLLILFIAARLLEKQLDI